MPSQVIRRTLQGTEKTIGIPIPVEMDLQVLQYDCNNAVTNDSLIYCLRSANTWYEYWQLKDWRIIITSSGITLELKLERR